MGEDGKTIVVLVPGTVANGQSGQSVTNWASTALIGRSIRDEDIRRF